MYHTTLLAYRLVHKGPGLFARLFFEHFVYRIVFAKVLYLSSFLYDFGQPTDSYTRFSSTKQVEDGHEMGFVVRIIFGVISQRIAEKIINDQSPWECVYSWFYKTYSLVSLMGQSANKAFWWVVVENLRPLFLIFGVEILLSKRLVPFKYEKLRDGEMRILATSRDWWFRVSYTLHAVSTNHEHSYEAISYTWGQDKTPETITIGGRSFQTTKTVANILRRRTKLIWLQPGTTRCIWLDSICINQGDDEEKSVQVQGMRDIYARAWRVLVCLGGEDRPGAGLAGWLLLKLHALLQVNSYEELAKRCMEDKNTPSWVELSTLLAHRWFRRVWVIQEIAVAKKIWVTYGGGMLHWDIIQSGLVMFGRHEMAGLLSAETAEMRRGIPRSLMAAIRVSIVRHRIQSKEGLTLRDAVMMCVGFEAEDPRDKILALFGLITDDLDPKEWIDYSQSIQGLYLKTANHFLSQPETPLRVLSYAGIGHERNATLNLPSWIPDWSCIPTASAFVDGINTFPYRACGTDLLNARSFSVAGQNLNIRAKRIDTVAYLAAESKISYNGLSDEELKSIITLRSSWLKECIQLSGKYCLDPYHNGQPIREALWRCFLADRTSKGRPAPEEFADAYEAFEVVILSPPGESSSFDFIAKLLERSRKFEVNCAGSLLGRKFCVSANRFMGLVPTGARSGDEIWLAEGGETLLLVREENGVKRLVGESFMMGCMDGEWVGGGKWENLTLS
jgi:hypothetical protein